MNKKRLKGYESPTTELIELRVEGVICQSTGTTDIPNWGDDSNSFPDVF